MNDAPTKLAVSDDTAVSPGTTSGKLSNLVAIGHALQGLSFKAGINEERTSVRVPLNVMDKSRTLVISENRDEGQFVFAVDLCSLADLPVNEGGFALKLLALNMEFLPFAVALLADTENEDPAKSLCLMVHGVSNQDCSVEELADQMAQLNRALTKFETAIYTV